MIFHPKTSKIPNLQKCYQYGLKPIIEGVMSTICKMDLVVYFWPNKWTWNYDISQWKNPNRGYMGGGSVSVAHNVLPNVLRYSGLTWGGRQVVSDYFFCCLSCAPLNFQNCMPIFSSTYPQLKQSMEYRLQNTIIYNGFTMNSNTNPIIGDILDRILHLGKTITLWCEFNNQ